MNQQFCEHCKDDDSVMIKAPKAPAMLIQSEVFGNPNSVVHNNSRFRNKTEYKRIVNVERDIK